MFRQTFYPKPAAQSMTKAKCEHREAPQSSVSIKSGRSYFIGLPFFLATSARDTWSCTSGSTGMSADADSYGIQGVGRRYLLLKAQHMAVTKTEFIVL